MRTIRYIVLILAVMSVVTACYYRPFASPNESSTESERDSLATIGERGFALNSNFEVIADTLWLHQLPFRDTVAVIKGDLLVVAEFSVHPEDTEDSVWVKVARDQETIGWIREKHLLKNIVPDDPISQCIHWFSSSHALPFFIVLGLFFIMLALRALRKKRIKLSWIEGADSIYPILLMWMMASAATVYNSMQHFVPQTWERYYYSPTLNPFDVPFILSIFLISVMMILILAIALIDDISHLKRMDTCMFYLVGLASCCIFIYIFFTWVLIYLAYVCYAAFTVVCIICIIKSQAYTYQCGACGGKMRSKGTCPHCGAMNE